MNSGPSDALGAEGFHQVQGLLPPHEGWKVEKGTPGPKLLLNVESLVSQHHIVLLNVIVEARLFGDLLVTDASLKCVAKNKSCTITN